MALPLSVYTDYTLETLDRDFQYFLEKLEFPTYIRTPKGKIVEFQSYKEMHEYIKSKFADEHRR